MFLRVPCDSPKPFVGKSPNCDDPFESNFFKYFAANFNRLGLKKLITTSYDGSPIAGDHVSAWSKGGDSSAKNCQMLCVNHNRAKGI